jgi:hypothetical protein
VTGAPKGETVSVLARLSIRGCDHEFALTAAEWDAIGDVILSFLDRADHVVRRILSVYK